jgi:hypothetical protein
MSAFKLSLVLSRCCSMWWSEDTAALPVLAISIDGMAEAISMLCEMPLATARNVVKRSLSQHAVHANTLSITNALRDARLLSLVTHQAGLSFASNIWETALSSALENLVARQAMLMRAFSAHSKLCLLVYCLRFDSPRKRRCSCINHCVASPRKPRCKYIIQSVESPRHTRCSFMNHGAASPRKQRCSCRRDLVCEC